MSVVSATGADEVPKHLLQVTASGGSPSSSYSTRTDSPQLQCLVVAIVMVPSVSVLLTASHDSLTNKRGFSTQLHVKTLFSDLPSGSLGVRVRSIYRFMKQQDLEIVFMENFRLYSDAIFRFCLVKVSNQQLAEDMTQEVFMRYWKSLRDGKGITNARAFLYTIANNLAKDWYKRRKSVPLEEGETHDEVLISRESSPETVAAYNEAIATIEGMEDIDKEVLLLRLVEGFEPRDISEIIGETANVVSVRLNRAMARLKEKMHA
jgi:RNA polymerase sigma factor (sigma-70 family)